jgi:hypothetical protein
MNGEQTVTQTTHSCRIAAMVVVLTAIAAAAGAALVFSMTAAPAATARQDTSEFAGEWSPTATSTEGTLRQVAGFVQRRYLLPGSSKHLADVSVRQIRVADEPAKTFAIVHLSGAAQPEQVGASSTAVFSECGPNPDCSIPGTNAVFGELARRQALELALRALRAEESLDLIVVKLPAVVPRFGRVMVYFRRLDLERALERPLRSTLPLNPPPRGAYTNPVEQKALATLVVNYAFTSHTPDTDRQHAFVLVPAADLQAAQATSG